MQRLELRVVVQYAARFHVAPRGCIKVLGIVEIAEVWVARLGIELTQVSNDRNKENLIFLRSSRLHAFNLE
jgi:hypothetical protein